MDQIFLYSDLGQAQADLRLFSTMNCNEDRTLYLCRSHIQASRWQIHNKLIDSIGHTGQVAEVESIALNGTLYTPE